MLALRVPVGRVEDAVVRLGALGTVTGQQVATVDLQTGIDRRDNRIERINRAIRAQELRLESGTLTPAQELEARLRIERLRNEAADLRRANLADRREAATSELALTLHTRAAAAAQEKDESGAAGAAGDALRFLAAAGTIALFLAIVLSPVVLLLVLLWLAFRARSRRVEARLLDSAGAGRAPARLTAGSATIRGWPSSRTSTAGTRSSPTGRGRRGRGAPGDPRACRRDRRDLVRRRLPRPGHVPGRDRRRDPARAGRERRSLAVPVRAHRRPAGAAGLRRRPAGGRRPPPRGGRAHADERLDRGARAARQGARGQGRPRDRRGPDLPRLDHVLPELRGGGRGRAAWTRTACAWTSSSASSRPGRRRSSSTRSPTSRTPRASPSPRSGARRSWSLPAGSACSSSRTSPTASSTSPRSSRRRSTRSRPTSSSRSAPSRRRSSRACASAGPPGPPISSPSSSGGSR